MPVWASEPNRHLQTKRRPLGRRFSFGRSLELCQNIAEPCNVASEGFSETADQNEGTALFEFVPEELPAQSLSVKKAEIEIHAFAPLQDNKIALYVNVEAEEIEVPDPQEDDFFHDMKPRFYTEWLDIPVSALQSGGLDCLDGYRMEYRSDREAELGYEQSPGAVYDKMHASFTEARMSLDHIEAGRYRVTAQGKTEFGWQFNIETEAVLTKITMRSQNEDQSDKPDVTIEKLFAQIFDPSAFKPAWKKHGSEKFSWYVYEAYNR